MIGPSGCGKSTILNLIAGFLQPTEGEVLVGGQPIPGPGRDRGMIFQQYSSFPHLTVMKNVLFWLEINKKEIGLDHAARLSRARDLIEQVGLSGFENYSPSQLSGGMKKRAAFARAMALDPEILFFDEPSAGLDPITAAGIDDLILSLKKAYGLTMVVVTHELASAFLIADRIILIDHGNIAAMGRVDEVRNSQHPRVRQFLDRIAESTLDDDVDHLRMYTEGIR